MKAVLDSSGSGVWQSDPSSATQMKFLFADGMDSGSTLLFSTYMYYVYSRLFSSYGIFRADMYRRVTLQVWCFSEKL